MKMQEIRDLSEKERDEKLSDLREEYFNLKFQLATGKIENPGRLRHMRRDIARIITLQSNQATAPAAPGGSQEESGKADKK